MIKIANTQFWVHDQDEALAFYSKVLGWEVRADVSVEAWNFRWLSVGPAGQDGIGLVLMPIPGPPMLDQASGAQLAELVAKGAVRKNSLVKVLGDGELTVKVELSAHKFSGSAREKITAAGGSATEL